MSIFGNVIIEIQCEKRGEKNKTKPEEAPRTFVVHSIKLQLRHVFDFLGVITVPVRYST